MAEETIEPIEVGDVDEEVAVTLVPDEDRTDDDEHSESDMSADEAVRASRPHVDWSRYQNTD